MRHPNEMAASPPSSARSAFAVTVLLVAFFSSVLAPETVGSSPDAAAAAADTDGGETAVPYIIGGAPKSNPGYVAVLLRSNLSDPEAANFCGGSLIRVDVIMTAAHCVDDQDPEQVQVGLGHALLSSIGPEDRLEVSQIAVHPDWVLDGVLQTDIALLRLTERTFGYPVVAIEQDPAEPSPPRSLEILGWGYTDPDRDPASFPDVLQAAGSTTLTGVGTPAFLANQLCLLVDPGDDFCHGTVTTGTCQGDSGGPILAETAIGSGVMEVVGIVSFGPSSQCLHPTFYDGGQRVSPYLDWIGTVLSAWDGPPDVAVDQPAVAVAEGGLAANSGTFVDPEDHPVTVSASIGTVTQDSGGSGTWHWSHEPADGPADTQTVTITASDGSSTMTTFELTVTNLAPTIEATGRTVRRNSGPYDAATFSDPGTGDGHTATVDWGTGAGAAIVEGSGGPGSGGGGSVRVSPGLVATGDRTVTVCVTDHDGSEACDQAEYRVIADLECPDPVLPFVDLSESSFAFGDVGCIFGLGITTGTSASTYDPAGVVTREQMAAFVARFIVATATI
jgi:hypothetical protein